MYSLKAVAKWHCKPLYYLLYSQIYLLGNMLYFQLFWKWPVNLKRNKKLHQVTHWGKKYFMEILNEIFNGHLLPHIQEALPQTLWKGGLFTLLWPYPKRNTASPYFLNPQKGSYIGWLAFSTLFDHLQRTALKG